MSPVMVIGTVQWSRLHYMHTIITATYSGIPLGLSWNVPSDGYWSCAVEQASLHAHNHYCYIFRDSFRTILECPQ